MYPPSPGIKVLSVAYVMVVGAEYNESVYDGIVQLELGYEPSSNVVLGAVDDDVFVEGRRRRAGVRGG